jgi:HAD superfamily hydrolase (TIGR01456 family)
MRRIGIALDIDGVLLRGVKVLPYARDALDLLLYHRIPFVFVTNGGGKTETAKAHELSTKFNINFSSDQIIMAHTPYRGLQKHHANADVLVIGHDNCINIMKNYGFKRIITPMNILATYPTAYPGIKHTNHHQALSRDYNIKAAFVVHDPTDWTIDMQILSDILIEPSSSSRAAVEASLNQKIPVYACNADLVYTTEHHLPRYTQGAFVEAFRHLFEKFTKTSLQVTHFGKPFPSQYSLAEQMIQAESDRLNQGTVEAYYGIGDNPVSDIRGANNAGYKWSSVLVRTGIFQGKDNDVEDPADVVVDNVLEAVEHIIRSNT